VPKWDRARNDAMTAFHIFFLSQSHDKTLSRVSALGTSRTRSGCIVMRTNCGARRAYGAPFSFHGPQFVSFLSPCKQPPFKAHSLHLQLQHGMTTTQKTRKETRICGTETTGVRCGRQPAHVLQLCCPRISRLSSAERVLYAALAPSIQPSGVLKSACCTWEDALWAAI
jgi:hypothetical protein